jgi:hypothetical protein
MKCLLVRQPYASLISYGIKRIEFRNRPAKIRGQIALASSRGPPLKTSDEKLNKASKEFPRGKILAIANLDANLFLDNKKLNNFFSGTGNHVIHDIKLELANSPLGEPISDIKEAISNNSWWSYGWFLSKIIPIKEPIELLKKGFGPWIDFDKEETLTIINHIESNSSRLKFS